MKMILLNEPWREREKRERYLRLICALVWLCTRLGWVALGLGVGWLLFHK